MRLASDASPINRRTSLSQVPELRHLRYFVAVAEELNFSRAATRLHMAQPPLSVAIRQLEQELDTELFVRSSREVRLTDAGRALLDGARRTLLEADRAVEAAKRAGAGKLGRLRVGFSWSARFQTLPVLGRAFAAGHPDVELLSQEIWNAQMVPALMGGTLDVAVALCPELASGVASEAIRAERVVAVVGASHPFAVRKSISVGDLADESFLLFPRELAPRLHDAFTGICRRAGFEPNLRAESFHTGWDLDLLADDAIVALAPESVAGGLKAEMTAVALDDQGDLLETRLLWRSEDPSVLVQAFRSVASKAFESPQSISPGAETLDS
jgi:DNA-binding transcriptional LysR family regulator